MRRHLTMPGSAGVLRCPACQEFIGVDSRQCRFCGAPIDTDKAKNLASKQGLLDDAIGGARNIKIMAPSLALIALLTPVIGLIYPIVVFIIIEILAIRWLVRYKDIRATQLVRLRRQILAIIALPIVLGPVLLVLVAQFWSGFQAGMLR